MSNEMEEKTNYFDEDWSDNEEVEDYEGESIPVVMDSINPGNMSLDLDDDEENSEDKNSGEKSKSETHKKMTGKLVMGDLDEDEDSEEIKSNDVLSSDERLRVFSDGIISSIVGKKEIRQYALNRLMSSTNPKLFRDENYVIFSVYYNYRDKIKNLNIDEEFIKLYLKRNKGLLQKSKGFIDIHAYGEIDGSEELGYISGVIKQFNRLAGMQELSESEFDLMFEKYLIEFKAIEASKVYTQSQIILNDGLTLGNKKYSGFEDSFNYSRRKLAEIDGLVNVNQGRGYITMNEVLMSKKEESKKPMKIGDFGKLDTLNKVFGGIFTGTMYEIIAPPKAGKSKLCAKLCHIITVGYGNNVTVWAQEGGYEAWSAQMRAIHFDYTYNQNADVRDKKYGVTQDVVLHERFPSQELQELEMSSKLDLASNPEYGIVDYVDRPFEVETFIEDIDASVKANNSKAVIIDYPQLIESANDAMSTKDRVSTAYIKLLAYCRTMNVAIIIPAQYKQESFNQLLARGETASADLRTAGAESSQVLRTPDIIFALWATTQDLQNNSMKILSVPCRFNKAFPEFPVYADLGTCEFIDLSDSD